MPTHAFGIDSLAKIRRKVWRARKRLLWQFSPTPIGSQRIVWIVGHGKCGKSLMARVLDADSRTTVFKEDSCLTGDNRNRLRLKPLNEVRRIFTGIRAPIIVAEPKSESQRALDLLDAFPHSSVIWMFRGFRDSVEASCRRWNSQVRALNRLAQRNTADWRCERMSDATHSLVALYYNERMSRADAAALMWYARNILFFEQQLCEHPRAFLCSYDALVTDPVVTMRRVYRWLKVEYPSRNIANSVTHRYRGMGASVVVCPEVAAICQGLEDRLIAAADAHQNGFAPTALGCR